MDPVTEAALKIAQAFARANNSRLQPFVLEFKDPRTQTLTENSAMVNVRLLHELCDACGIDLNKE